MIATGMQAAMDDMLSAFRLRRRHNRTVASHDYVALDATLCSLALAKWQGKHG